MLKVMKVKNYAEMSERACGLIVDKLKKLENPVLGLATGSTPKELYRKLIEKYKAKEVSFQHTVTFNLDEYVGVEKEDPNSYFHFMSANFFKHIDIPAAHTHIQNGMAADLQKECWDYEQKLTDHGPVHLQLLGLGVNGHIGFNEPGTSFASRTHIAELDASTRQANARFFDSPDDVPEQALSMGIKTIMDSQESKRQIVPTYF